MYAARILVKQSRPFANKSLLIKLPFLKYCICCLPCLVKSKRKAKVQQVMRPMKEDLAYRLIKQIERQDKEEVGRETM